MRMRATLYLCLVLVLSQQAFSQELEDNPLFPRPRARRIFIGPMIGYNDNFNTGNFLTLGGPVSGIPDCGEFNQGSGNGLLFGLTAEYWFKEGGPTSLQFRVYYEQKPGTFNSTGSTEPYFDPNLNNGAGGDVYFYPLRNVQSKYNLINFEVQYKYNLPGLPHFGVAIGPKFGLVSSSNYVQTQTLLPAPGTSGTFDFAGLGSNEQTIVPSGPISGASAFRLGLIGSIQYEALLGPLLVTPRISYDYGVTKVVSAWQINSLIGSIEFKYGL